VRYQNEEDVASQLVGFLQQFLEVFSELKGKNFYLTGESVCCVTTADVLRIELIPVFESMQEPTFLVCVKPCFC
jgi:hypothetical protein